jgi:membrane protease YdiL (CAAX protease family)
MIKGFLHDKPYYVQFIFLLCFALVSLSLFSLLGMFLLPSLFGINLLLNPEILNDYTNPDVIGALKTLQIIQAISLFIIPATVFPYFVGETASEYLKTNRRSMFLLFILVIAIAFISSPAIELTARANAEMHLPSFLKGLEDWMREKEDSLAGLTKAFLKMNNLGDLSINLIMVALLPAIGEEFLFRGVIQRIFIGWTKNAHLGILITAILFSAMHVQFYGFIPRMLLGVLFGYLFFWSGNIWIAVLAHFLNNGTVVVFSYMFQQKITSFDIEANTTVSPMVYIISIATTALLLLSFYRTATKKEVQEYI